MWGWGAVPDAVLSLVQPAAELERGPEETRLEGAEIELTQCALFALQVSLARLWSSYGVRPTAVVGHSLGEVAAAVLFLASPEASYITGQTVAVNGGLYM